MIDRFAGEANFRTGTLRTLENCFVAMIRVFLSFAASFRDIYFFYEIQAVSFFLRIARHHWLLSSAQVNRIDQEPGGFRYPLKVSYLRTAEFRSTNPILIQPECTPSISAASLKDPGARPKWFGEVGKSTYLLFRTMTLRSWPMEIVLPVMKVLPYT